MIEIEAGVPRGTLDHALNDAVTSRAPKGAAKPGLSTYWIDRTERELLLAIANGIAAPFASGNVTYLRTDGEVVIAAFDFDPQEEEAESVTVHEFVDLLARWRDRVIEGGGASGADAADLADPRPARPAGPVN